MTAREYAKYIDDQEQMKAIQKINKTYQYHLNLFQKIQNKINIVKRNKR